MPKSSAASPSARFPSRRSASTRMPIALLGRRVEVWHHRSEGPAKGRSPYIEKGALRVLVSNILAVTIQLEDPFPLTPALSPWEREIVGGAGNGLPFSEYSQSAQSYSLSSGERVDRKSTRLNSSH